MEELKEILRKRDLKATSTRLDVLATISNYNSAIPYSEIQKSLIDFDRVTLYRTINILVDKGIIHKATTIGEESYFAMCGTACNSEDHQHDHIHFTCKVCNKVSCLHLSDKIMVSVPGHQIDQLNIEASGTCDTCMDSTSLS